MTTKTRKRLDEGQLLARLAKKHPAPAWAFLTQVRNATGYSHGQTRTCDAMAMSLWPSRGIELHGFEVKSHRGDWIKELKTPEKAEVHAKHCHRWWLVAEGGVVETSEVPPTWGLIIPKGRGLTIVKQADLKQPEDLSYSFLAALLRKVEESMVPMASIEERLQKRYKEGMESAGSASKHMQAGFAQLQEAVASFQEKSGVRIDRYDGVRIGESVKRVLQIGPGKIASLLKADRKRIQVLLDRMDECIADLSGEDEDE